MELLTIGAFARASRLSPKALANQAGGPDNIACVVADVIEPQPG